MAGEKHLRLQVSGGYNGTGQPASEVWSFNLRLALEFGSVSSLGTFANNWDVVPTFESHTETNWVTEKTWTANGPAAIDFDPESYLNDQAAPAVADFVSGWKFSPRVEVRKLSLYPCDTTGNAIDGNFAHLTWTGSNPVGAGTNLLPLENSVAVSWGTDRLGPRGRGRIYTPTPGTTVLDADGLLAAGDALDLVDASVALLQGLAIVNVGVGALNTRPVVTGPTAKPGIPAYTQYGVVNEVRVGHVIDTQRRRRNAEAEGYSTDAVTY